MSSVSNKIAEILKRKDDAARKPNPAPVGRRQVSLVQARIELGLDVSNRSQDSTEESAEEDTTTSMNGSKDRLQLIKARRDLTRKVGLSMGGNFNQFTMAVPRFNPKIQFETSCSEDSASEQSFKSVANITRKRAAVSPTPLQSGLQPLVIHSFAQIDNNRENQGISFAENELDASENTKNVTLPLSSRSDGTFVITDSAHEVEVNSSPFRDELTPQFIKNIAPERATVRLTQLGSGFPPSAVHSHTQRGNNRVKQGAFFVENKLDTSESGQIFTSPLSSRNDGTFTIADRLTPQVVHEHNSPLRGELTPFIESITPKRVIESPTSLLSGYRPPAVHNYTQNGNKRENQGRSYVENELDTSESGQIFTSPLSSRNDGTFTITDRLTPQATQVNSSPLRGELAPSSIQNITPKRTPVSLGSLRSGFRPPTVHNLTQREDIQENHENEFDVSQNDPIIMSPLSSRSDGNFEGIEAITPQPIQVNRSSSSEGLRSPSVHRFGRRIVDNSIFSAVNASPAPQIKRKRNIPVDTDTESSLFEEETADGIKEMILKQKKLVHPATPPVGVRRSQRVRLPRLRYWAGEGPLYNHTPRGGRHLVGTTRVVVRDPRLVKAKTTDFLKLMQREHKRK